MAGRGSIQTRVGKTGPAYLVRVEFPRDPVTGARRQRAKTFDNKKEAERQLALWLSAVARGTHIDPDNVTVGELCDLWLDTVAAHAVEPQTLEDYALTMRKHVIPALGGVVAQKLTAAHVQKFLAEKRRAGTGARTVELCHRRLSQVLKHAVQVWEILPTNVCDRIAVKPAQAEPGKVWTPVEGRRFLDVARDDFYWPLWLFLLATGARRGEALGIRWRDLDVERATVTIRQKVMLLGGATVIRPRAKTAAGFRPVKLPPELLTELVAHRKRQLAHRLAAPAWVDNDLIFATRVGTPINPNNVLRTLARLCDKAGVPRIKIHGMRHTHATWLIGAGRPVNEVAQRLGHKRPSITLDVYAHVFPDQQDASVAVTRAALFQEAAESDGEQAVNKPAGT